MAEAAEVEANKSQKDKVLDLLMKCPKEKRLEYLVKFHNFTKEQGDVYEQASKAKD